jgi:uncharacterized protein (DUF1800 family)
MAFFHTAVRALLLAALTVSSVHAAEYALIYRGDFETLSAAEAPSNDAQAARFLTQASFGPTRTEIARLRQIGYRQWIEQQLAAPTTRARPFIEAVRDARIAAAATGINHGNRLDRWFHTATYAPDQLRQRMAFALSQIFVISEQGGALEGEYVQVTEYWDLLARSAFGSYRQLLQDVTYNPSMGKYLSHFRNRKAATGREPDENYAREVMQLFSVGLVERNLNFSPRLNNGQTIATYDQTTISQMAKVFTGFGYSTGSTNIGNGANDYAPMRCWDNEHDVSVKTILGGVQMPAGRTCAQDLTQALDVIANHANVAPFISRQLIQRFVTSNPSAAYIQRVATVFNNNGRGERGDLGAVITAVLMDTEARNNSPAATFGKLREPLLRLTALWRAWDAEPRPVNEFGETLMGMTNPLPIYGQRPLGAPTVFNFYEPDYQHPGPIANASLFSPEFQLINESTTYQISNNLAQFAYSSYVGMANPPTNRPLLALAALEAQPSHAAMVQEANIRMLYGSMSTPMRDTLVNMLDFMSGASNNEKARSLIQLIAMSPEYAVQR